MNAETLRRWCKSGELRTIRVNKAEVTDVITQETLIEEFLKKKI